VIPILAYHKVGAPVQCRRDTFLNVSEQGFRRQMKLLARLGYRTVPFADLVEAYTGQLSLPRRAFVITFDDGYRNVGQWAAPTLAQLHFTATVFIVSQRVGQTNSWDRDLDRPELPLMDWEELKSLAERGWEIGGHTRTHPRLDTLNDEQALEEIAVARDEIAQRLGGIRPQTFCYPFGRLNGNTPALVRAAGFRGACTARSGMLTSHCDPFLLPRVKVAYRDGALGLLYRLLVRPYLPNLRPLRQSYRTPRPVATSLPGLSLPRGK
jgi:peptidoglycan/xylan/chitin deacetylase (PgdA/CDA1 family)